MIVENLYWRRRRDFLRFYVKKPVKNTQFSICTRQICKYVGVLNLPDGGAKG